MSTEESFISLHGNKYVDKIFLKNDLELLAHETLLHVCSSFGLIIVP